ncbi:MAG: DUF2199 domain-containing protein [Archangium sp.]
MSLAVHRERPEWSSCECCNGLKVSRTRFVSKAGEPYALCLFEYAPHTNGELLMLIELEKEGFFCRLRIADGGLVTSLGDAASSPWGGDSLLARMLTRDEALAHPRRADVFALVDQLCREDMAIENYFARQTSDDPSRPLEHRFRFPDEIFALGAERRERVKAFDDVLVLDGARHFVRCALPISTEAFGVWNVFTWVEVDDAQRVNDAWRDPEKYGALEFTGTIANDFASLLLPVFSGTKVEVRVVNPYALPQVKSGEALDELLSVPWPRDDFERYAVELDFL